MTAHEKLKEIKELKEKGFPEMPCFREILFDWNPNREIQGIQFSNCQFGKNICFEFSQCDFHSCEFEGESNEVVFFEQCYFSRCKFKEVPVCFRNCRIYDSQELVLEKWEDIKTWGVEWSIPYWELFSTSELRFKIEQEIGSPLQFLEIQKREIRMHDRSIEFHVNTDLGRKKILIPERFNNYTVTDLKP